jgi:hypothetical protein
MPQVPFASLPPHARLWIFAADHTLTGTDAQRLLAQVDGFVSNWKAHGVPLTAARDWRHDRFLFVAVDEQATGASGCSIDALTRSLKDLERDLGVSLLDSGAVYYRQNAEVRRASRPEFRALAERGAVSAETPVFDNTVPTVAALMQWERTAGESWHAKAFPLRGALTR